MRSQLLRTLQAVIVTGPAPALPQKGPEMSEGSQPNRRRYQRLKITVPVEIHVETSSTPLRGSTSDLSLGGCYIESIFPFPVGTVLDLRINIHDATLPIEAKVATSDPQVGNGISFTKMLPEDQATLKAFLDAAEQDLQTS
jgi:c-di-GMP-binding flagellar brake protein YcgR